MNEEKLKTFLIGQGAAAVGFSTVEQVSAYPNLSTCVSILFPLSKEIVRAIGDKPTHEYFHHYRTVNAYLDRLSLLCAAKLEAEGYGALAIAASQSVPPAERYAGLFSHKTGAVLSGLGFIGKNCQLISYDYGCRVRLSSVLCDLPIAEKNRRGEGGCGDCSLCVKACPAGALWGENYTAGTPRETLLDADKCSKYMKEKFQLIGRGSVCGVCMAVCPYNKL